MSSSFCRNYITIKSDFHKNLGQALQHFSIVACSGDEEEDFDDDATEVMSDVDSQETVDYNSDDTIVMDAESVQHCREKLMNMFELHSTTLKVS